MGTRAGKFCGVFRTTFASQSEETECEHVRHESLQECPGITLHFEGVQFAGGYSPLRGRFLQFFESKDA